MSDDRRTDDARSERLHRIAGTLTWLLAGIIVMVAAVVEPALNNFPGGAGLPIIFLGLLLNWLVAPRLARWWEARQR